MAVIFELLTARTTRSGLGQAEFEGGVLGEEQRWSHEVKRISCIFTYIRWASDDIGATAGEFGRICLGCFQDRRHSYQFGPERKIVWYQYEAY